MFRLLRTKRRRMGAATGWVLACNGRTASSTLALFALGAGAVLIGAAYLYGVAVPHANGVVVSARRDAFAPGRRGDALHRAFVPDEERRLIRNLARDAPLRVHLDAPGAHDAVVAAGDDDAAVGG